ncbi:MAG: DUF4157 domain-containing protein [Pseudomonadota bacterium]
MATQAQAKQVQKSKDSRSDTVQRKEAKRQIKRKTTNVAPAYLQAKLNVSAAEDPHEREADQVAENVMRMPAQRSAEGVDRKINRASLKPGITPLSRVIARVISRDSLKPGEQVIHRASLKPGEDAIQRKAKGAAPAASDNVENRINAKRGQGERLPDGVRGDMETRFGRDFSAVRIHTDKDASEMSSDIEAKAFTVGNDIFFGNGRFDANSDAGKRLLAHELTHVAQQQQAPQTEQEDAQQAARSETKAQRWSLTSWLADKAWGILKKVAPSGLYTLVKEVYKKGIFGYLKEKISAAVSSIFNGLKRGADVLSNFFASFGAMAKTAKEIIKALAAGDCKPLFAAVKQLKDTIAAAAGDAWQAIKDFFKPIGAFFSDLWASWGAPVLDWLKKAAGDVWTWLKDLGKTIWDWTKPVRDYASSAWSWLKGKLELGGSSQGDSEGGIMGWIKEKAQSAWVKVKEVMDPVIKPVKKFAGKVMEILPIKAILNLRETVQGWLKNAESMGQAMGDDGADVADKQISLREQILPAVIKTMQSVRNSLSSAGLWLGEKIGGLATDFTSFISGLRTNPILKHVATVLNWVETGITNLGNWAKDTVQSLFTSLGNGLVKLSQFIEPVLNTLQQVADTILNLLGKLPGLILGPLWNAIPKCIRDPLKDFVLNQILGRIPFFKQLLSVKDAWEQIKATGLRILKQVFVDGNLFGALWTLFKAILRIFNLPAKLITNIIIKGAQSLGAIIAAPLDFLINILRAMKLGFSNFFSNILTHLLKGAMDWLFGAVKNAGLTAPIDFSPKSIFTFVLDILGLTMDLVWKKLAEKMAPAKVEKLKKMAKYASGALEWIKLAVAEGPVALWGKIKEKLSDIWNMVLEGVIGWINTKIIAWATRWLMSLLDVTGIMPIINATIAIYKAIQSFMQHLKAMLEVVNSVLNGVADLAAGAIESAAKFLEGALVRTIPIVIGFLANQAGLGNIAEKIKEILTSIRCKVEEAVGWLVGKVVDTVKAFVDKVKTGVKAGVQAIKEWWKKRKAFKTKDGGSHSLFFKGNAGSAEMTVASNPKTIRKLIKTKCWEDKKIPDADIQAISKQLDIANTAQAAMAKGSKTSGYQATADQAVLDSAMAEMARILGQHSIELSSELHKPTGSRVDPILINWYKKREDYATIVYRNLKGKETQATVTTGLALTNGKKIKVVPANIKNLSSSAWLKQKRTADRRARYFLQILRDHHVAAHGSTPGVVKLFDTVDPSKSLPAGKGDMSTTYEVDHVRDRVMGGPDSFTNLWPMMATKNNLATKNSRQLVIHKGAVFQAKELPIGVFVKVNEQVGTAGGGVSEPYTGNTGKTKDELVAANRFTGDRDDPVQIKWFKNISDYPTLTLETTKNNKTSSTTYNIGQKVKISNTVSLQVHHFNRDIQGNSWKIQNRPEPLNSSKVTGILNKLTKSSTGNAIKIEDGGKELKPIPTDEQTQGDHLLDRAFGGKDDLYDPGNIWVMRADKNNAASANSSQYVVVKGESAPVQANKIDGKWVKIIKQTSALQIGSLATNKENPAGKEQLMKIKKSQSTPAV